MSGNFNPIDYAKIILAVSPDKNEAEEEAARQAAEAAAIESRALPEPNDGKIH